MAEYLDPYRKAVDRFGPGFEATLWLSREKQALRFSVIASMVDLTDRVVIDAGCALGDFAAFMAAEGIRPRAYIGLEGVSELVDEARERRLPGARFELADFVADADAFKSCMPTGLAPEIVVFSGSLNTLEQAQALEVLGRAWNACEEAVVFNFLSRSHRPPGGGDPGPARRFDPVEVLAWALKRTPRVILRQDYMGGHDATVAMLKVDDDSCEGSAA